MTSSPTFSPAAETTTPPPTSGSAAPRPSPPGPTSPASPWLHNHAYRRASLSPSHFPSICRSQVDGAVPASALQRVLFEEVAAQFLAYLRASGCSPNTARAYGHDLTHLAAFLV